MQNRLTSLFPIGLVLSVLLLNSSIATAQEDLDVLLTEAMASDVRTDAERARDKNRRPKETLEFFGIKPEMKVLELIPGGGWYTKLLAPALYEKGQLYLAIGTDRIKESLLNEPNFDRVKLLEVSAEIGAGDQPRLRTIGKFDLNENGFDAVLTFRNMHNFDASGRLNINQAVFNALKPGGVYGVVDHTRRHMQPFTAENRRRADPVDIIKEALQAGFEFVDYSDLHYKPDDELRYEVGRKSVAGNTDRFTLLFRKPI